MCVARYVFRPCNAFIQSHVFRPCNAFIHCHVLRPSNAFMHCIETIYRACNVFLCKHPYDVTSTQGRASRYYTSSDECQGKQQK